MAFVTQKKPAPGEQGTPVVDPTSPQKVGPETTTPPAPAWADTARGPQYMPWQAPNPAPAVAYNRENPYVPWQAPNPAPAAKPLGKYPTSWEGPPAVTNDAVRSPYGKYPTSPWEGPTAITQAPLDPRLMQRQALLSLITRG